MKYIHRGNDIINHTTSQKAIARLSVAITRRATVKKKEGSSGTERQEGTAKGVNKRVNTDARLWSVAGNVGWRAAIHRFREAACSGIKVSKHSDSTENVSGQTIIK